LADAYRSSCGDTDLADRLRQFTSRHPDDQPPVQPGIVRKLEGSTSGVLLGFSSDIVQLSVIHKSIDFTSTVGHMKVKASFETKYILYKEQLAL